MIEQNFKEDEQLGSLLENEMLLEIQAGDIQLKNNIINRYKPFIAKIVSNVCKRYICDSDDEFSIGLMAFNEALELYSSERGYSLIPFAKIIIKRRVIDYIRKESKHTFISFNDQGEKSINIESKSSMRNFQKQIDQKYKKEEIILYHTALKGFGLSFSELQECAPRHKDARQQAFKIAQILVQDEDLKNQLFQKRKVPIKQLEEYVDVSRKTIERNRKYIIAVAIILSGDYLYLKDYISDCRLEMKDCP